MAVPNNETQPQPNFDPDLYEGCDWPSFEVVSRLPQEWPVTGLAGYGVSDPEPGSEEVEQ